MTAVDTTSVASATAGIGAGAVGSYAFMHSTGGKTTGNTAAGSTLKHVGISAEGNLGNTLHFGTVPTGTWRVTGNAPSAGISVWLRIA